MMWPHFLWKCINFSHDRSSFSFYSLNDGSSTEQKNLSACNIIGPHQLSVSSPMSSLTWQHVVSLIVKALFCMQFPAPHSPFPRLSTPLQFSIKIQTEIDDLNGGHCWVPDHGATLQQTFKRVWGVVYWVTVNSDYPHLSHIFPKLCPLSYHTSSFKDNRCRYVFET